MFLEIVLPGCYLRNGEENLRWPSCAITRPKVCTLAFLYLMGVIVIPAGAQTSVTDRSSAEAAKQINLIPTPQQIELGEKRYETEDFYIARPAKSHLARSGAEEINRRIKRLNGRSLPVKNKYDGGPAIVLATWDSELGSRFADRFNVSDEAPGEQGYIIEILENGDDPVIAAIGSDWTGTFYAAVSLRRLIRPADDGPRLLEASVRDWPAFARRSIGTVWIHNEPHPEEYIRWLGRHKINYINLRGSWLYDSKGQHRENTIQRIRELTKLAGKYGITCKMGFKTDLKGAITKEEWEKFGGMKRRNGKRWFSWSAHPVHRRRARRIARFLKETNINYMSLHVVDGGGYKDPEQWSRRSKKTREMYGDDHAQATADQVNIYREVLHDVHPEAEFEVVPYPYHFQFAVPNVSRFASNIIGDMPGRWWTRRMIHLSRNPEQARRIAEKLKNHHRALEKQFPDDVLVTFREGGTTEFNAAAELWNGHPLDVWAYLYRTRAWRGMWEPQDHMIKTWHRPDHRDMFYNALMPYGRAAVRKYTWAASGAEYTWNVNVPDTSSSFTVKKRYYDVGVRNSTGYQRTSLIPRVAARMWGESGPAFEGLMANNVSFYYLNDPRGMLGHSHRERFMDPYRYYPEQVKAVKKARNQLNELVHRMDRSDGAIGRYGPLKEETVPYEYTMILYWMTNMAAVKGHVQLEWMRARRLAKYGRPLEAQYKLRELLAYLPELRKQVKQVENRIRTDDQLSWTPDQETYRWSGKGLTNMNIDNYKQSIEEQIEQLTSGVNEIPESIVD